MAIKKADILGYLYTLGCAPVWNRLSVEEQQLGKKSLMGCYCRLMESLEKDILDSPEIRVLHLTVRDREHLNAALMLPRGNPSLEAATRETAEKLFDYLRGTLVSPAVKAKFLGDLDKEFSKILGKK